ncbi:Substance-K receptor [Desmophyllum pertusum]|uniref:Substance-K receptor n=1 Tax=Desmophyllum pertusum TaxID=174260 RepID=A0A9W9ZVW8_9CNID|nr:Substance-K receptor [Desmophyllum pertusum]
MEEGAVDKNASLHNINYSSPAASFSTNNTYQPAVITTVLFSFVIATGFPGNLLIVCAIIARQQLRTPCYVLVLSIAIADLGMALIGAPQRIIENYIGWPFGKFMCNFLVSIPELFVSVSVVTHTAIALERYRAIVQPFKERMSLKMAKVAVAAIWFAWLHHCSPASSYHAGTLERNRWKSILCSDVSFRGCPSCLRNLPCDCVHSVSFIHSIVVLCQHVHCRQPRIGSL